MHVYFLGVIPKFPKASSSFSKFAKFRFAKGVAKGKLGGAC
jgi:hypothetical protein